MGESALAYVVDFIQGLDDAPAEATEGAVELARTLREGPPETGGDFDALMAQVQDAVAHTFEYAGPGYLAYIPGGGLFSAALADFVAQGVNRYVGLWQPSPAAVQIEENVARWLCDLFAYPAEAQGLLLSGGSMANLSAMVTARHAKLGEDFLDGTYYVSEQAHASVTKAATIAGFAKRNVRIVATDDQLRMDPDALRARIREGSRGRHAPVPGGRERRHHEHGGDRPARRDRGRRGGGGALAPRRRRLRGLLPAHGAGQGVVPRRRAERLRHARSAQGHVPALRHRRPRGPRRTGAPRRALRGCCLPAGPPADGRVAQLQRVLGRALARLARPARVDAAQAPRRERLPRGARREAGPRRLPLRGPRGEPARRGAVGTAAHGGALPPGGAPTRTRRRHSWPRSTPPSGCSCPPR